MVPLVLCGPLNARKKVNGAVPTVIFCLFEGLRATFFFLLLSPF